MIRHPTRTPLGAIAAIAADVDVSSDLFVRREGGHIMDCHSPGASTRSMFISPSSSALLLGTLHKVWGSFILRGIANSNVQHVTGGYFISKLQTRLCSNFGPLMRGRHKSAYHSSPRPRPWCFVHHSSR